MRTIPANCSFTLMSVVRRSDLVVAIGTGGRSPALAAYLRRMLDEELGPEYETLLDLLSEAREASRASGRSTEDADWQAGIPVGHRRPRPGGPDRRGEGALEHVSLIVVGLNHRTVPVELLERMTVPEVVLPKALHDLAARENLLETSCSRRATAPRSTRAALASTPRSATSREFLAAYSGADPDDFTDHLYTYYDDAAVTHLFSVAAGLDSMIVGESEILGQVKRRVGCCGARRERVAVARSTLPARGRVGQARAHRDGYRPASGVDPGGRSHSCRRTSRRSRRRQGARGRGGPDGQGLAATLRSRGVGEILDREPIARTRADGWRAKVGGEAIPLHEIADTLVDVDVLMTSTASGEVLVERSTIEMVIACRDGRPLADRRRRPAA